jgi:hypothetical protein
MLTAVGDAMGLRWKSELARLKLDGEVGAYCPKPGGLSDGGATPAYAEDEGGARNCTAAASPSEKPFDDFIRGGDGCGA